MIALSWMLKVEAGTSVIVHVMMYMAWMMWCSKVREGCARYECQKLTVSSNL